MTSRQPLPGRGHKLRHALAILLCAAAPRFVAAADAPAAPAEPATPAAATAAQAGGKRPVVALPDATRPPVVTEHAITIDGREVAYRAEAGMLPLLKETGEPRASVFFVAYTLVTQADPARRPIMFCFNGGPGSSAIWLHLGGLGPRRARVEDDGSLPPPPFELVDNEETILPFADLVFIDPVATGFSRPAKDERSDQFFGKDADIGAMAEFIRLYTTRNARWRSPKYLCGESYGVFRAAGLAAELQERAGMFLSGLVLVSGLVDYGTIRSGASNDLPFVLFLPAYTAVAHHHGRLPEDLQADRDKALAEARGFAAGQLVTALHAGAALPEKRRAAVAAKIARFTGLPEALVLDHDLRIDPGTFREELLADERLVCGRLDGRITGRDGDQASGEPRFDPSQEAALGPLAAALNAYVREELKFESDLPYRVSGGIGGWSFEQNAYSTTTRQLADALSRNPHLRVLVQSGLCDLAVPPGAMRHSVDHLRLDPALRANFTFRDYDAGHMMYLNTPDRVQMRDDLRDFLAAPAAGD